MISALLIMASFSLGMFFGAFFHERGLEKEVRTGFIETGSGDVYRCYPLKDVSEENPYEQE